MRTWGQVGPVCPRAEAGAGGLGFRYRPGQTGPMRQRGKSRFRMGFELDCFGAKLRNRRNRRNCRCGYPPATVEDTSLGRHRKNSSAPAADLWQCGGAGKRQGGGRAADHLRPPGIVRDPQSLWTQGGARGVARLCDRFRAGDCGFAVFRRTSEVPLYRIEKTPRLSRRQGAYAVVAQGGLVLGAAMTSGRCSRCCSGSRSSRRSDGKGHRKCSPAALVSGS